MNKILSFTRGTDADLLLPFTDENITYAAVSDMYITLYQKDFKMTKKMSDGSITLKTFEKEIEVEIPEGGTVPEIVIITRPSLHLTQEETLNFQYGRAELHVKVIYVTNDGNVVSAIDPILWVDVKQSLYDEVIIVETKDNDSSSDEN